MKTKKRKVTVWADYDPEVGGRNRWAFYTTKADQRANRPDLKPIKITAWVSVPMGANV